MDKHNGGKWESFRSWEALERAGRNNSLQIYEPVEKNIEKYQELRADMNHLYQKIY